MPIRPEKQGRLSKRHIRRLEVELRELDRHEAVMQKVWGDCKADSTRSSDRRLAEALRAVLVIHRPEGIDVPPVPVSADNSLIDGSRTRYGIPWRELDLAGAWIDPGPSPAGNPGPYLKARRLGPDRTVHRIYPRRPGARPELRDGVWWWV